MQGDAQVVWIKLGLCDSKSSVSPGAYLSPVWTKNWRYLLPQRRVLRLGKPPRRWKKPAWAATALWEPLEVVVVGRPLNSVVGECCGVGRSLGWAVSAMQGDVPPLNSAVHEWTGVGSPLGSALWWVASAT